MTSTPSLVSGFLLAVSSQLQYTTSLLLHMSWHCLSMSCIQVYELQWTRMSGCNWGSLFPVFSYAPNLTAIKEANESSHWGGQRTTEAQLSEFTAVLMSTHLRNCLSCYVHPPLEESRAGFPLLSYVYNPDFEQGHMLQLQLGHIK